MACTRYTDIVCLSTSPLRLIAFLMVLPVWQLLFIDLSAWFRVLRHSNAPFYLDRPPSCCQSSFHCVWSQCYQVWDRGSARNKAILLKYRPVCSFFAVFTVYSLIYSRHLVFTLERSRLQRANEFGEDRNSKVLRDSIALDVCREICIPIVFLLLFFCTIVASRSRVD